MKHNRKLTNTIPATTVVAIVKLAITPIILSVFFTPKYIKFITTENVDSSGLSDSPLGVLVAVVPLLEVLVAVVSLLGVLVVVVSLLRVLVVMVSLLGVVVAVVSLLGVLVAVISLLGVLVPMILLLGVLVVVVSLLGVLVVVFFPVKHTIPLNLYTKLLYFIRNMY